MSSDNTPKKNKEQEIDLYFLWKKIIGLIDSLGFVFVRFLYFLKRNAFILTVLFVIGIIAGYFLDSRKEEAYKHNVILIPNFDSTNYLYEKIKTITFKDSSDITTVEIVPIVDVFSFLSTGNNLKIAEFMSESNVNYTEHKPDNQTEKIYKYHILTVFTKKQDTDGKIVSQFLDELNKENHFIGKQKIEQENTKNKIEENLASIKNINAFFEKLGNSLPKENKDLNIEMYPEVNGLLNTKQSLMESVSWLRTTQQEQSKIFYDVSNISNIKVKTLPKTVILPFMLIILFLIFVVIRNLFKRYNSGVRP